MDDVKVDPSPTDIKFDDYYVTCGVCEEKMEYKVYFAQEHLAMHPDHMKYYINLKESKN
jgi:hypothetical protein